MSAPKRVQRSRARGWRMPEGAVYVGRPSRWGNPVRVGDHVSTGSGWRSGGRQVMTTFARDRHDLECWCPLDEPCHADVLLRIANEVAGDPDELPVRGAG